MNVIEGDRRWSSYPSLSFDLGERIPLELSFKSSHGAIEEGKEMLWLDLVRLDPRSGAIG